MRFIHSADWHVGATWKALPLHYRFRQSVMIDNIYKIAAIKKVDTVLLTGDLFHKKEPNTKERILVLSKLLKYDKKFNTIIIEGNHDSVDVETTNIHDLKLLYENHKFKRTIIVELENKIIPFQDGAFIAMPCFNKTELKNMVAEIKGKYKWVVAMLHTTTIGCSDDKGWTARDGWSMKNIPGITYYALGHIHRAQQLTLPNAFQCGSPMQHNFGEALPKGVLLVDTEEPTKPKLIKVTAPRPLYVVHDNEEIPTDGYVKLITNESLLGRDLPPNVIATGKNLDDIKILKYNGELQPTKGLGAFLAKEGLEDEEQKIGIDLVEDIVKELIYEYE